MTSTVTLRFAKNGDGTVTSTELDDAGALPCAIQYVDPGPDLQVSTGQTCTFGGVAYKLGGTVQATSATMNVDLWYYNGGPNDAVTGDINANCTH